MMAIKVLLADDHKIVRDGLRSLLEKDDGLRVIGEAANGQIAVDYVANCRPMWL